MTLNTKNTFCLVLLIICFKLNGQQLSTFFYNKNWEVTSPGTATYYRFSELNTSLDFYNGKYTDYSVKGNKIVGTGEYSSGLKNGEFIEYYLNGNIKAKGNYKDDILLGDWYYYYPNGQLKMILSFLENDFQPIEFRDTLNNVIIENGTGIWNTEFLVNKKPVKLIAKFKNGKRNGEWKYFNNAGKKFYSEDYVDSKLIEYHYYEAKRPGLIYFDKSNFNDPKYFNIENRLCEFDLNLKFVPFKWIKKKLDLKNTENISYQNSDLPIDQILFIKKDTCGNSWIGTANNGLIKYDSIFTFYNKDNTPIKGNNISTMEIDKNGKLWFSFKSSQSPNVKTAGVACMSDNKIAVYNTSNSGLTSNGINSIAVDKNNIKWFATENCIVSYDDSMNIWEKHYNKESEIRKVDTIKYKNREQYLKSAKKQNSISKSWIESKYNKFHAGQLESITTYYSRMDFYETPIEFYNIEILPSNEKLICSIRNGCCTYNDSIWECNKKYAWELLTRKFLLNPDEIPEHMNQLSQIMKSNIIFQLLVGRDNSLWVRSSSNIFKLTRNKIIEYDLSDEEIECIPDGNLKSKFYYLEQDKQGNIWACINSAILKIE